MKLVPFICGKRVIQFICMIVVAMTSVLHVDASFASTKVDGTLTLVAVEDDAHSTAGKVTSDLCNFCSGTAACVDALTPSFVQPVSPSVPSGQVRSLIAFRVPTTAPPPRS